MNIKSYFVLWSLTPWMKLFVATAIPSPVTLPSSLNIDTEHA